MTSDRRARVDLRDPRQAELATRIGRAWTNIRRGAHAADIRNYILGIDGPLETGQMDALDVLARSDRTMSTLADRLRIDRSTATRAVDRLVQMGWAERSNDRGDRRVVTVRITPEGRRLHSEAAQRRSGLIAAVLDAFDDDEREQLAGYLERFTAAIDDHLREVEQASAEQASTESADAGSASTGQADAESH